MRHAQVTFLVILYRMNELIQTRPDRDAPRWDPSPTTTYLATSFAFSLAHYALYAIVVGIRRLRNMHVVPVGTGRASTYGGEGEQHDEREASVRFDPDTIHEESGYISERFADEEYDGSDSDTTTDEDEIIDIPHLRSRASRITVRSEDGLHRERSRERERGSVHNTSPRARRVRQYGSINSLGESPRVITPSLIRY
jgi:hypothetical protein